MIDRNGMPLTVGAYVRYPEGDRYMVLGRVAAIIPAPEGSAGRPVIMLARVELDRRDPEEIELVFDLGGT